MDKKTAIETLIYTAYEKGGFNGAWLYAENGEIVSKGGLGYRDPEDQKAEDFFWSGMQAIERDKEPELGYIIT